jgi:hypothetical protein
MNMLRSLPSPEEDGITGKSALDRPSRPLTWRTPSARHWRAASLSIIGAARGGRRRPLSIGRPSLDAQSQSD